MQSLIRLLKRYTVHIDSMTFFAMTTCIIIIFFVKYTIYIAYK